MRTLSVALTVLAACTTACTDDASSGSADPSAGATGIVNCVDPLANPVTVLAQPELTESPRGAANLVLQVTNSAEQRVRITVEMDDRLAVDTLLPAARHSECVGSPIYQWYYAFPPGRVTLTATREGEPEESFSFQVLPRRRWIVIDAQRGFPLEPRLFTTRPVWG